MKKASLAAEDASSVTIGTKPRGTRRGFGKLPGPSGTDEYPLWDDFDTLTREEYMRERGW